MKIALLQLNVSDDPAVNLIETRALLREAVEGGAEFVLTPEVTNCVSTSRSHQQSVLAYEEDDATLAALREEAAKAGIWLLIGSLGLKTRGGDGRFANRCFLMSPQGEIVARYDKIHMFDVDINETESYRESAGYRPGDKAVLAETPFGKIGMSICYDMRFPALYQALAEAGARILTMPAAFSSVTGAAHWHSLLRARAIETGSYVVAPAQVGEHEGGRRTWGHSMIIDPWGETLSELESGEGVIVSDLSVRRFDEVRQQLPAWLHRRL